MFALLVCKLLYSGKTKIKTQASKQGNAVAEEALDTLFSSDSSSVQQIEESIYARLQEFLDGYEPNFSISDSAPYTLHARYKIHYDKPIPTLDTRSAKAYAVTSLGVVDAEAYALIVDNNLSFRLSAADVVAQISHENAIRLLDRGRVYISEVGCYKRSFIYEKPPLLTLEKALEKGNRFHERQISYQLLIPVVEYLKKIGEKGYSHGRINPGNLFLGKNVILGECVSDRSGISQDEHFEPIERLLADRSGRGEPDEKTDVYALGMVVYGMLFGLEKIRNIPIHKFTKLLIEKGAHSLLIGHKEMSPTLDDFFRGIFVNDPTERWGLDQLTSWLDGKRFSLVLPSVLRDSSRSVIFNDKEYYSAPAIATAFKNNWNAAHQKMESMKIDKWAENTSKLSEYSNTIEQIVQPIVAASEGADDAMSRLILTLDPHAPIRSRNASAHLTGIGSALSEALNRDNKKVMQELTHMISTGLPQYSVDLKPQTPKPVLQHLLWQLPTLRQILLNKGTGFGMNRVVYEMNSSLPCQSPLLQQYAINDPKELLKMLDKIAKDKAMHATLDDKEIAAFLACKINIMREQKIRSNIVSVKGQSATELVTINILAAAQNKLLKQRLPGLSTWVAIRLSDYINNIHSRKTRAYVRSQVVVAAKTGVIQTVLNAMFNGAIVEHDAENFKMAGDQYRKADIVVQRLQQKEILDRMVKNSGDRLSVSIGYVLVFLTSLILLYEYVM